MKFYLFGLFFMVMGQICPLSGEGGSTSTGGVVDTSYFAEMAQGAACSDRRNELFLVDDTLVIWYVAGDCADASHSVTLFDGQTQAVICSSYDSIAGPQTSCTDESYRPLFDALSGGGKGLEDHKMEPIPVAGVETSSSNDKK